MLIQAIYSLFDISRDAGFDIYLMYIILFTWLTCIVTIRGSGCRVLAPPSMAIPRVLALFATLTSVEVGSNSPGYIRRTLLIHIHEPNPFMTLHSSSFVLLCFCAPCAYTLSFLPLFIQVRASLSPVTHAQELPQWIYTLIEGRPLYPPLPSHLLQLC